MTRMTFQEFSEKPAGIFIALKVECAERILKSLFSGTHLSFSIASACADAADHRRRSQIFCPWQRLYMVLGCSDTAVFNAIGHRRGRPFRPHG
jgi:hypothetical protein